MAQVVCSDNIVSVKLRKLHSALKFPFDLEGFRILEEADAIYLTEAEVDTLLKSLTSISLLSILILQASFTLLTT